MYDLNGYMVQYGIWPNCPNKCDFCLLKDKDPYTLERQHEMIDNVIENIKYLDEDKFSYGISILGGDIFYIRNKELQDHMMKLFDSVIGYIKRSKNPNCKFSTVTNGIYEPDFLTKVLDKFKDEVGIDKVDINFSYDLKYRYKSEKTRLQVLENINYVCERYDYGVGVQMILTQNVINLWKEGKFDIWDFCKEHFPKARLTFLYPHPISTGKVLEDFFFKRNDFIDYMLYLREEYPAHFANFLNSVRNSARFKHSGLQVRVGHGIVLNNKQPPVLANGQEIVNDHCGHSTLYQCYSDSKSCMLCDLESLAMDN